MKRDKRWERGERSAVWTGNGKACYFFQNSVNTKQIVDVKGLAKEYITS